LVTSLNSIHGSVEHLHRYALAKQITKDKIVLDIASGEGYGSFLLSNDAKKVYGVDIDLESVEHAKKKYANSKNLEYLCGSTSKIPLPDHSIDVVVSFETIEHHDQHDMMMQEILRVLKEDGYLLISSPEKSIYKRRDPNNPFHIKELSFDEFKNLINKYFKNSHFFIQKFIIGSLIHSHESNTVSNFKMFDGNYSEIKEGVIEEDHFYNQPFFNLAICSNAELSNIPFVYFSTFNGVNVVKKEIASLKAEKNIILNSISFKIANKIVSKFSFLKKLFIKI
ncbi:MAG: class I SAM-dependent methyltransferase, partial [Burkholderiales bacterium]|nr:class I SAM-dependent methyltransferase [Bacteroidia bacterium]